MCDYGKTMVGVAAGEGGGVGIGLCGIEWDAIVCEDGLEEGWGGEAESEDGGGMSHDMVEGAKQG